MTGRLLTGRLLKSSVVALAFLVTTTPAWAGTVACCFKCYLDGVDKHGCLTPCGGECAEFYACVNTCTGKFTGKACGCVQNCSCCPQCYKCRNFFCDPCWSICVSSSCYSVGKCGACTYTACGTVY
jgi:hypothetical protein